MSDKVNTRRTRRGSGAITLRDVAKLSAVAPITASRASEIESQDGLKVWSGTMDVASALNQDVVTDFPIAKAVGKLDPGVYLVTARPWKGASAPAATSEVFFPKFSEDTT